jgi:pSer/pThr/pTyr-binding forkhead associated (FHA) protein
MTGRIFRIPEGIYVVGRKQLSPRDCHISRRHMHVACTNGIVFIQDAGSANRTYIDAKLAKEATQLAAGQQLCIAGNTATYTIN